MATTAQTNADLDQIGKILAKHGINDTTNDNKIVVDLKNVNGYRPGFVDSLSGDELPEHTRNRFAKYGIDLSKGYPERPENIPHFLDEGYAIRNRANPDYVERGRNADPSKKNLLGAAKEIREITPLIGTEVVGLQLGDLNEKQLDELALLVAERVVVVFRNQDLSPQKHLELGKYYGEVEEHPLVAHVPGLRGATTVWGPFNRVGPLITYKKGLHQGWHTDLDHEFSPAAITHLHLDSIPTTGGDTGFASGYGAFDKLSQPLQQFLEGKTAVHKSAHRYLNRDNVLGAPEHILREHPLVITHPVTGWKSLFVNRAHTVKIVGLEDSESQVILNYLFDVYEKSLDIQTRVSWQPTKPGLGTSVIWDNRVSNHIAIPDYNDQNGRLRHAVRVTSLGNVPNYDKNSKSQREALFGA
ncbi:hypothetical protein PSN45_000805 [Yamadazyma tenuis]|uniref:TauD-domain-containing protein n=1 Tax=Candida tenuis (strain ATCC 10573 / BCRC 21748 / CBS 615 / JCM 9827 / NBRC 10315 / NRRL Y-1498 / VKM Y-70) TaxID=590646 RepID=G3BAR9_CANTC|nr:uncharacterized protein CANTEDRAFT_125617 [Yamadazyma tenuis ATCC 10573]XP_006688265.1 TauD-domain-containing protein [Yamadazyma tenuis ATCC 10573]EGV62094.1 hypothetical protein CANTEDRAFT_125617 [Yamadazyma tenuis ATCC 10573]EGV62095.1 TauD-domain-containing protein [Yamadazyma tenuis ATCC 10573]WEJ93342.1 hypothetical protein PSN45_000805 [Yamadazyma tenuis]